MPRAAILTRRPCRLELAAHRAVGHDGASMTSRERQLLFGLAAAALLLASLTLVGVHSDVLLVVPALALALPLLAGRYVGEEQLARLAAAFVVDAPASRVRARADHRARAALPAARRAPARLLARRAPAAGARPARPPRTLRPSRWVEARASIPREGGAADGPSHRSRRRALRARGGHPRHIRRRPRGQPELRVARARPSRRRSPASPSQVLNGDDRLEVENAGRSAVTIDGYSKDPYIRMSPGGKVEVNLRSPAYYLNQDRFYGTKVPASATAKAARADPQWRTVARTGRYEFHDHRMHWMAKSVPQQVTDKAKRTKIVDWSVPLHAQGATGAISGSLFWRGERPGRAGRRVHRLRRDRAARRGGGDRRAPPARRRRCRRRWRRQAQAPQGGLVSARRRALSVASVLLAALLLAPAAASAHALLVDTVPQRGATLEDAAARGRPALQRGRRGQLRRGARLRRRRQARRRRALVSSRRQRRAARRRPEAGPARRHVRRDVPRHLRRQPSDLRRPRLLDRRARRGGGADGRRSDRRLARRPGHADRVRQSPAA